MRQFHIVPIQQLATMHGFTTAVERTASYTQADRLLLSLFYRNCQRMGTHGRSTKPFPIQTSTAIYKHNLRKIRIISTLQSISKQRQTASLSNMESHCFSIHVLFVVTMMIFRSQAVFIIATVQAAVQAVALLTT